MKYKEKFYARSWLFGRVFVECRFRFDPVPYIHRRIRSYFKCWYKTPKTINEKRQVSGNEKYVRARRNILNLPNVNDDYSRSDTYDKKSWKKNFRCRKQWDKKCQKKF